MTIIIGCAHVGFKYFSFILGMGFLVLSEHPMQHGLYTHSYQVQQKIQVSEKKGNDD